FWINYNLGHALIFGPGRGPQELEEAVGYFRVAVALRPGSAEAHSILGLTFFWKGDLDKAIAGYQRAIAIDQKFSVAHSNLARAVQFRGDLDGAIRGFNKAIALDSKSASVHNELAWLLATCADPKRRDPRQAVAEAQQAVELEPKDGTLWN